MYMLSTQPDPLPRYTLYRYVPLYLIHTGKGWRGVGEPVGRLAGRSLETLLNTNKDDI